MPAGGDVDLDEITAHICQSLGWTWDQVDAQMDLPRLKVLNGYWRRSPPVHVLVAAYVGYKPPPAEPELAASDGVSQIFDMLSGSDVV